MPDPGPFRPAWWLAAPHLQTLYATLFRGGVTLPLQRRRLELADGDFLDLDYTRDNGGPQVLMLHGLEGSVHSPYAKGLLKALHTSGLRPVLMHFRGCSGTPNRLPRSYHSGETGDLERVVYELRSRHPGRLLAVVGISLGGNALLKWLGEQGAQAPVHCGVAVSVPFDLHNAAERLDCGFSKLYQWILLRRLRISLREKFGDGPAPIDVRGIDKLRNFRQFDDQVTAKLHGFAGVDDYYTKSSSRQFLKSIRVPTLILHARDDPFMLPDAIPKTAELSAQVQLEVSTSGGHVGFISGKWPWQPRYWLEQRIPAFLMQQLMAKIRHPINPATN